MIYPVILQQSPGRPQWLEGMKFDKNPYIELLFDLSSDTWLFLGHIAAVSLSGNFLYHLYMIFY